MPRPVLRVLAGLAAVLAQWLIFSRLPLWGVVPDVVLLYVALVALRSGRLAGAVAGFWTGLLVDVLVNPATLGLNTLVKTVTGFVIGLFRSDQGENLRVDPVMGAILALIVAVFHNGLMTIALALDQDTRTPFLIVGLWFGGAVYTAFVAAVLGLFRR